MRKFKIGAEYNRCSLYGADWDVVCVTRTDTTCTFKEVGTEGMETIKIELDEGNEVCECWEYRGAKAYIQA